MATAVENQAVEVEGRRVVKKFLVVEDTEQAAVAARAHYSAFDSDNNCSLKREDSRLIVANLVGRVVAQPLMRSGKPWNFESSSC